MPEVGTQKIPDQNGRGLSIRLFGFKSSIGTVNLRRLVLLPPQQQELPPFHTPQ